MKKHLSGDPNLSAPLGHWNGVAAASTSLLGSAGPDGPTNSCNLLECAPSPDGIGNKGLGCVSWGFQPSCSAI